MTQLDATRLKTHCLYLARQLNRIAIIGSGPLAYTSDFTERVNCISREAAAKHQEFLEKNANVIHSSK